MMCLQLASACSLLGLLNAAAGPAAPAAASTMSVEEYEERCELRNKGDPRPDQKRRQLVREAARFMPEQLCLVAA